MFLVRYVCLLQMWNYYCCVKRQHVFIKYGVMDEWTSICHDDWLTEYISQHTAHNDQFPLDAINTIKKTSNGYQLESPITIDFIDIHHIYIYIYTSNTTDGIYISTQYFAWHHRRQFHINIQYTCLPLLNAI